MKPAQYKSVEVESSEYGNEVLKVSFVTGVDLKVVEGGTAAPFDDACCSSLSFAFFNLTAYTTYAEGQVPLPGPLRGENKERGAVPQARGDAGNKKTEKLSFFLLHLVFCIFFSQIEPIPFCFVPSGG